MASFSRLPSTRRLLLLATCVLLVLFTPPVFSALVFFCPLIVSTTLAVLAVVSFLQHGGSAACQEDEASEDRIEGPDLIALRSVTTENVSEVLKIGDQEVTWLEWLHNEDLKKSRAHNLSENWELEELDVAAEASASIFDSERSVVDPSGPAVSVANVFEPTMS